MYVLPPAQSGARGLERFASLKIIMYKKGKVDPVWESMLPKIRIASKKASNKSGSALNFVQKSPRGHTSISP